MGRLANRKGPDCTYFVTTKAWQNVSVFQVTEVAETPIAKLLEYRDKKNYLLHEFVLMPNHLDLLLTPSDTTASEKAVGLIKSGSSHEIHHVRQNKMQIWQPGFHESRVTGPTDYKSKADYIHFNPVAAHLDQRPQDWLFSSASLNYKLDPPPHRPKPIPSATQNVGARAAIPVALSAEAA